LYKKVVWQCVVAEYIINARQQRYKRKNKMFMGEIDLERDWEMKGMFNDLLF